MLVVFVSATPVIVPLKFPEPEAATPVILVVLSLVQLQVLPETLFGFLMVSVLKLPVLCRPDVQTLCNADGEELTVGFALTYTVS